MNIGKDNFPKISTIFSISYSTFSNVTQHSLPITGGSLGLSPSSLAKGSAVSLIKVHKDSTVPQGSHGMLALEHGRHALRKPKDPMERNQGPHHWLNCQLKVITNLPALWLSHLGSKSLILAISTDTQCTAEIVVPVGPCLNWISRTRINHCCFRH